MIFGIVGANKKCPWPQSKSCESPKKARRRFRSIPRLHPVSDADLKGSHANRSAYAAKMHRASTRLGHHGFRSQMSQWAGSRDCARRIRCGRRIAHRAAGTQPRCRRASLPINGRIHANTHPTSHRTGRRSNGGSRHDHWRPIRPGNSLA